MRAARQQEANLEKLTESLKSKLDNQLVPSEVIAMELEFLHIACDKRKSEWDSEMQYVAKLGVGKEIMKWLRSDPAQWSAAMKSYAFRKNLCFFLLAEGREKQIWELLESVQWQNAPLDVRHEWRGMLFGSLVRAKIQIGQQLHGSIDDAIGTFFALERKKNAPRARDTTKEITKWPAEVQIARSMRHAHSANTNSVLWDMFYESYIEETPEVRNDYERNVAMIRLFHPTRPDPGPAYDYIIRHFLEEERQDPPEGAFKFTIDVWARMTKAIQARGSQEDFIRLRRLQGLSHRLQDRYGVKDKSLRMPKQNETDSQVLMPESDEKPQREDGPERPPPKGIGSLVRFHSSDSIRAKKATKADAIDSAAPLHDGSSETSRKADAIRAFGTWEEKKPPFLEKQNTKGASQSDTIVSPVPPSPLST